MMWMTAEQLPVFVYGTLRAQQGNYRRILAGRTVRERPASLADYMLVGSVVPFAVAREGRRVVGEVMDVHPEAWEMVLRRLDRLEGYTGAEFDSLYVRRQRVVQCADGESVRAYFYEAGPAHRESWLTDCPEVPGGDWVASGFARTPSSPRRTAAGRSSRRRLT
ncbi:gamma-glutamylcyclotransferase family protein [Streptomyces sp. NPDC020667]|uniref:gamma-glutamylcyclotransferase family protein n=1 Tax=Streptomyces sp. NPDC020667 TaxID=3154895 RepID=UPI0033FAF626